MYQLSTFVEIEPFILNSPNIDSPVGELSTQSKTYSLDMGIYSKPGLPQYTLNAFKSVVVESGPVEVPTSVRDIVINVADWIYQAQTAPTSSLTKIAFLASLTQQWSTSLGNIDCGALVLARVGVWFPEWISYTILSLPVNNLAANGKVMCWFADASFQAQYTGYNIKVVPPLANLDVFFGGKVVVKAALNAMTRTASMLRVQAAKQGDPESNISSESYDYVNPANAQDTIPTDWVILIYGKAGNDEDAIRQAIRDYISANSTRTENEWKAIFPDIYRTTEFVIFPRWSNYAVEDRVQQQGVYSPVSRLDKELNYIKARLPMVAPAFLNTNTAVIPTNYKSLTAIVVGGDSNRQNLFAIDLVFPDLINAPTTDTMFALQAPKTQTWLLTMQRVFIEAEKATTFSNLPLDMRKVLRTGVLYITVKLDNINYLVATKATTPAYI